MASNSRVTGFPGRTTNNSDTVLLTVERSLFKTSILINSTYLKGKKKKNYKIYVSVIYFKARRTEYKNENITLIFFKVCINMPENNITILLRIR